MAKLNKEQQAYLDGMLFAQRIAKTKGLEELDKEIQYRGLHKSVLNVERGELLAVARGMCKDELYIVATASAVAIVEDFKMPPSKAKEYLINFNNHVEEYHMFPDKYKAAQERMDRNYGLSMICAQWQEENHGDN